MLGLALCSFLLGLAALLPFDVAQIGRAVVPLVGVAMNTTQILLAAAHRSALVAAAGLRIARLRRHMPALFVIAPLPALAAALCAGHESMLVLGNARFALRFALDLPGAMLLGVRSRTVGSRGHLRLRAICVTAADGDGLVVCWLMTLTGCVGVFLAADLIGFYFLLAVLSVGASGLVLQGEGSQAIRASAIYLGLALLAEAFLLAGLILLAQATPDGSLLIRDAAAALPSSPWRDLTLILLLVGLGMKAGLVPLHFWMPLAYGEAPIPAAAVMSGAVVKASILALIRFLPFGAALPDSGHAAGRDRPVRRDLRRAHRHHAVAPQGHPCLFERQPDGFPGGGDRHGAGGRR